MNDIGIWVHSRNAGYHNYEAPLSWDVRLGVSQRHEVLAEVEPTINPGQVHNVLNQIGFFEKQINDAVVIEGEDKNGNKFLCAYVVANQKLTASELRTYLAESLPAYMIPARFVQLQEIPLTPNGKVDRKALQASEERYLGLNHNYTAPRTPTEATLAALWAEVLEVEPIGIHDNFFKLGGHSLLATQLIAKIRDTFQIDLPLRTLFEAPTIAAIADFIAQSRSTEMATETMSTASSSLRRTSARPLPPHLLSLQTEGSRPPSS